MKEEIEELWFKPYDEDSFLKNFCDVDYEKYLLIVVTDPNFSYFNQHALERKRYWDSGSVVFFDILEMLSNYFDLDTLDDRLVYVEDPIARKMSVKFKFWVDTERLYCLLFLALDDMMFNEERLLSSMIRFKRGLLALFEVYKPVMFEQVQFGKFMFNLKQHVLNLQKTFNQRKENLVALTKEIVTIINRIMKGERVAEREI
ncbi:MAG: hypothetical protein JST59_00745 [Actinobacteria bacterium]|nr:hypothetical protein [Actinomycetota bacterium]